MNYEIKLSITKKMPLLPWITKKVWLELNDICITAGLGPESRPYRDGSFEYYLAEEVGENDAKGVGPLIMCYVEAKKQEVIS